MQRFDLDDLDRTIIGLLTEDGRLSASEIASKIGTASERTVRNRITALLQSRMITIGAIPDPTAMGREFMADLLVELVDESRSRHGGPPWSAAASGFAGLDQFAFLHRIALRQGPVTQHPNRTTSTARFGVTALLLRLQRTLATRLFGFA